MTAAYRFKGIGWFGGCVAIVLGFYLVSLQVAAERKKLEGMDRKIDSAERDIRALETEFETRANLAQLEKWNGETLALAAPVAHQFVTDEAALASLDVNQIGLPMQPGMQTAALVVPSLPTIATPAPTAAPAAATPAVIQVAAAMPTAKRAVIRVAAIAKGAPLIAKLDEAARGKAAVAKVRPQAVAMLDKKLLSDTTLGDILSSARAEARKR